MANNYAVPQKRKRVIIICTRKDLGIMPADLYPKEITPKEDTQVTAWETMGDLETVECSDTARYADCHESDAVKFFKKKISYAEYVEGRTTIGETVTEKGTIIADKSGQLSFLV